MVKREGGMRAQEELIMTERVRYSCVRKGDRQATHQFPDQPLSDAQLTHRKQRKQRV